jgi:hypothetical protein
LTGFDLISDALPFGRLWYAGPNAINNAIGFAKFYSRSNDAVIRVCDDAGNVIETHKSVWRFHMAYGRIAGAANGDKDTELREKSDC